MCVSHHQAAFHIRAAGEGSHLQLGLVVTFKTNTVSLLWEHPAPAERLVAHVREGEMHSGFELPCQTSLTNTHTLLMKLSMSQCSFIILYSKPENTVRRIDYKNCEVLTNFPTARCSITVDGRGAAARPCPELGLGSAASPKHLHCSQPQYLPGNAGQCSVTCSTHQCRNTPHI